MPFSGRYDIRQHNIDLIHHTLVINSVRSIDELLDGVEHEDDIPFWAELWPSALGLASYLWEGEDRKGQRILELGCGVGLCSIVGALKGGYVLATDRFHEALEFARYNAHANNLGLENIDFARVDWRHWQIKDRYHLIIGSDILYEPKLHPNLQYILSTCLEPTGKAIIADPGRKYARDFLEVLEGDGWNVDRLKPWGLDGIQIFEITYG